MEANSVLCRVAHIPSTPLKQSFLFVHLLFFLSDVCLFLRPQAPSLQQGLCISCFF